MTEISIPIMSPDEQPVDCICYLGIYEHEEPLVARSGAEGLASFDLPFTEINLSFFVTRPIDPGFWCARLESFDVDEGIVSTPIKNLPPTPWWLELLDVDLSEKHRGAGVVVGVVDTEVVDRTGLEHVHFTSPAANAETHSLTHGEAVCRILADRSAPTNCAPICPGATVILVSGEYSNGTWDLEFCGPEFPSDIDPVSVANGVYELVLVHEVDVINLSLGTFDEIDHSHSGLRTAIEFAWSRGVVVVCAAGNTRTSTTAFPSKLPHCIAVTAFGLSDWGPPGTAVRYNSEVGTEVGMFAGRKIYSWCEGAYGTGLDFIAPGVGLVIARGGRPAYDVTGTSFSAPLNAGALAINLAHMREDDGGRNAISARDALKMMLIPGSGYIARASLNRLFQGKGVMVVS